MGTRKAGVGAILLAGLVPSCTAPVEAGRLYVASGFTDQVFVLDAGSGALLDSLRLDPRPGETDEPHGIAVAPDGGRWYATLSHGESTLWAFDAADDRRIGRARLELPGASRIRITPDGRRAFIPDYYRSGMGEISSVAVVDLETLTVLMTLPICSAPHDAAVSAAGDRVAIACSLSDEVVVLDASTYEELSRTPAGPDPGVAGSPHYRPLNAAWLPDGSAFFVGMHASAEVVRFGRDGRRQATARTGPGPAQIAVTSSGLLLVPNRGDGTLSVFDAPTLTLRAAIDLGGAHPHGLAVSDDGAEAWVALEGEAGGPGRVTAVDLEALAVRWSRELGGYLLGIAVTEPSG